MERGAPLAFRARVLELKGNLNSELCRKALEKVGNANTLVNLVSRRVRQLNSAGGTGSRPLIDAPPGMGVGDIALLELIEGKMSWEAIAEPPAELAVPKRRKRS